MWFLFPLVVLISSVLIGLLLAHEGFLGQLTEAERAFQNARLAALTGTYDTGSKGDGSTTSASVTVAKKERDALCSFQTSQCATSGTTQACCTASNAVCIDLTQKAADYKANTLAKNYVESTWTAMKAKATEACTKATADCVVTDTDTACCTASRPGCTKAAAAVTAAEKDPTSTTGTRELEIIKGVLSSGTGTLTASQLDAAQKALAAYSGSGSNESLLKAYAELLASGSSLTQGDLYNLSKLKQQNSSPTPTPTTITYGSGVTVGTDGSGGSTGACSSNDLAPLAPLPPLRYSDPIAVQVGKPTTYPFSTADKDTCETECC